MGLVAAILDVDIEHFPHCRKFWWTELAESPLCTSHLLPLFFYVATEDDTVSDNISKDQHIPKHNGLYSGLV